MDHVYESGASATPPSPPTNPSLGYPVGIGLSTDITKAGAWWFYMITEELRNIVALLGETPDYTQVNQCASVIKTLIDNVTQHANTWNGGQAGAFVPVQFSPAITLDLGASNNFAVTTLTSNFVFSTPINMNPGQTGMVLLQQDGVGGRSAGFSNAFVFAGGATPGLTADPNAIDLLIYAVLSPTAILAGLLSGIAKGA